MDQRKPPLFFNPDHDAVFFTHLPTWTLDGLSLAPQGVVFRAVRPETAPRPPRDVPLPTGLDDPTVPRDFLTRSLISHYWFMAALTWETWDWTKADEAGIHIKGSGVIRLRMATPRQGDPGCRIG